MLVSGTTVFLVPLTFHSSKDKGGEIPIIEIYYSAKELLFQVQGKEEGKRKTNRVYCQLLPLFPFPKKAAEDSLLLGMNHMLDIMLTTSQISSNLVLATTLHIHYTHCHSHFID